MKTPEFKSKLFRFQGKGGWTFDTIPKKYGPSYKLEWGRTPVNATVDGNSWKTNVWTEKTGKILLPVPAKIRNGKEVGDVVLITRVTFGLTKRVVTLNKVYKICIFNYLSIKISNTNHQLAFTS